MEIFQSGPAIDLGCAPNDVAYTARRGVLLAMVVSAG